MGKVNKKLLNYDLSEIARGRFEKFDITVALELPSFFMERLVAALVLVILEF